MINAVTRVYNSPIKNRPPIFIAPIQKGADTINGTFSAKLLYNQLRRSFSVDSKVLDKKSPASSFWGVTTKSDIKENLGRHILLILLKKSYIAEIFPKKCFLSVNDDVSINLARDKMFGSENQISELYKKPARMTFYGDFFGHDGRHTIGLVFNNKTKTLYCLDSLSNTLPEVQEYQEILAKKVFNSPNGEIKRIIFSNKNQQNLKEYTCNNWALANVEAVQRALQEGESIETVEQLNSVLPSDINKILREQMLFVENYRNSKYNNAIS